MRLVLAALLLLGGVVAGCSREDPDRLPAACRVDQEAVRRALRAAPERVQLDGVPLSECLATDSSAGDIQQVGAALLGAATGLTPGAKARPNGAAALQLGYLAGAVRRGSHESQGVHSELVRRLDQELSTVDTRSQAFRRGQRAGRRSG